MRRPDGLSRILCVPLLASAIACSGGSPTQPPAVTPPPVTTPTPPTTIAPPTTMPTLPVTGATCAIGKGDIDTRCLRTAPGLLTAVDAAIDRVVRDRPSLFNLQEELAPGAYRVLDAHAYVQAVVDQLAAAGMCAAVLGDQIQVKDSQESSEEYDIITSSGFIRRGGGSFVKQCSPAAFPLTVEDVLYRVHILPVGIECPDRRDLPKLDLKQIPLGCFMIVTATPKDKNLNDVDPRLHGPEIKWDFPIGDFRIKVEDYHDQPFNKKVIATEAGEFAICAEVAKVAGCMNGFVIP
jgi:hypothetical protein